MEPKHPGSDAAEAVTDSQIRELHRAYPRIITENLVDGALGAVEPHRNHSRYEIARLRDGFRRIPQHIDGCESVSSARHCGCRPKADCGEASNDQKRDREKRQRRMAEREEI